MLVSGCVSCNVSRFSLVSCHRPVYFVQLSHTGSCPCLRTAIAEPMTTVDVVSRAPTPGTMAIVLSAAIKPITAAGTLG